MKEFEKLKDKKIIIGITKSNFGGAQRYVLNNALFLKEKGMEPLVIFGGEGTLFKKLKEKGIKTKVIGGLQRDVGFLNEIKAIFSIMKLFLEEKPDIAHMNSSKIGAVGSFVGFILNTYYFLTLRGNKRIKVVFTAHGWAFNEPRNALSRFLIALIYWITIIFSDLTISVSENSKKQISKFPFIKNKIRVIWNGIEDFSLIEKENAREGLAKRNEKLFERFRNEKNLIWIGTISEFHPIKGLTISIDAIKKVVEKNSNVIFIIMGENGDERKKIENKILELNLSKNVFILGFVSSAPKYLKALDIFTLTSFSEALPYSLLEAGHAGLAVVATEVGGIPEVIKNETHGKLIIPGESEVLSEKILEFVEKPEERIQFGKNLKGRVDRVFNAEKTFEETVKIYLELIEN